jgi:protein-tyrosine phosphatase
MSRPHDNCYWVQPGRLLAGEYPGAVDESEARRKIRRLLSVEVTFFLDLTEEGELIPYSHLLSEPGATAKKPEYLRMPVKDLHTSSKAQMVKILDTIDRALDRGHIVYVHCRGGVGRTGTVVGCYLARHGLTGKDALGELKRLYRVMKKVTRKQDTPETPQQVAMVRHWAERDDPAAEQDESEP